MNTLQNQNKEREALEEAEADAEAVAKAFKNMPDDIKELVASNMDKVPKNGQVSAEWFYTRHINITTFYLLQEL